GRGLAGAIGTHKPKHLAGSHGEVEVAYGSQVAVELGEGLYLDHACVGWAGGCGGERREAGTSVALLQRPGEFSVALAPRIRHTLVPPSTAGIREGYP